MVPLRYFVVLSAAVSAVLIGTALWLRSLGAAVAAAQRPCPAAAVAVAAAPGSHDATNTIEAYRVYIDATRSAEGGCESVYVLRNQGQGAQLTKRAQDLLAWAQAAKSQGVRVFLLTKNAVACIARVRMDDAYSVLELEDPGQLALPGPDSLARGISSCSLGGLVDQVVWVYAA